MKSYMPGAILFCNKDISNQVLSVLQRQLYITDTISKDLFDQFIQDGYYVDSVKLNHQRVLVLMDYWPTVSNVELADVVLFVKNGLIATEKNLLGPPVSQLNIDKLTIYKLFQEAGKLPFYP